MHNEYFYLSWRNTRMVNMVSKEPHVPLIWAPCHPSLKRSYDKTNAPSLANVAPKYDEVCGGLALGAVQFVQSTTSWVYNSSVMFCVVRCCTPWCCCNWLLCSMAWCCCNWLLCSLAMLYLIHLFPKS
jgi:hypothetical protein